MKGPANETNSYQKRFDDSSIKFIAVRIATVWNCIGCNCKQSCCDYSNGLLSWKEIQGYFNDR